MWKNATVSEASEILENSAVTNSEQEKVKNNPRLKDLKNRQNGRVEECIMFGQKLKKMITISSTLHTSQHSEKLRHER